MGNQDIKGANSGANLKSYRAAADKMSEMQRYAIKGEELIDLVYYIDNLLSKGEIVTPLHIYDECERKFKKVRESNKEIYDKYLSNKTEENIKAYIRACVFFYGESVKSAIRSLGNRIGQMGLNPDDILKIEPWELNRTQNTYQYSRKGFSICYYKSTNEEIKFLEKKNGDLAKEFFQQFSQSIKTGTLLYPKQIEGFGQDLIKALAEEMTKKNDTLVKDSLDSWINKLNEIERNKVKGWEVDYIGNLSLLTKEFESISKSMVYAELLIKCADFVYKYQTSGEKLLPNMTIEQYAEENYKEAINIAKYNQNIAIDNKNTEKLLLYLIKYIEFLVSTLNYDELNKIFSEIDEIYKCYNKENNLDIYLKICYLRAKYLCKIGKYEESGELYKEVLYSKSNALVEDGVNEENVEANIEYSDIINDFATLYLEINDYKKAMDLYLTSLGLRRECAEIAPELYKSKVSASLYNISLMHMYQYSNEEAKESISEAIKIDRILAEEHPEEYYNVISLSQDLIRLSAILLVLDSTDKEGIISPLLESVKINEELYTIDNVRFKADYCDALFQQAFTLKVLKELDKALEICEEILKIYSEDNRFIKDIISTKKLKAEIYTDKEEYKKADELYQEALKLLYNIFINNKTYENFNAYINLLEQRIILVTTKLNDVDRYKKILTHYIALLEDNQTILEEAGKDMRIIEFLNKYRFNLEILDEENYEENLKKIIKDYQDLFPVECVKAILGESSEENTEE